MSKVLTPSILHVLNHIQSRTDCLLINPENFGLTANGKRYVQAIETRAFDFSNDLEPYLANPTLTDYKATLLKDLYEEIDVLTILPNLGNDELIKEAQSWCDELKWAYQGKTVTEIDKLYLDKYLPLPSKAKKHTK